MKGIIDKYNDFMYVTFSPEYKCEKCPMLLTEKVSYEYEEYEDYCMYGKDCDEDAYCFTPLFILNLLSNKYKKRFEQQQASQWDGLVEYMEENNLFDEDERVSQCKE